MLTFWSIPNTLCNYTWSCQVISQFPNLIFARDYQDNGEVPVKFMFYNWSIRSGHKNPPNVAVCKKHLFYCGLINNTAPIIFTHICIVYQVFHCLQEQVWLPCWMISCGKLWEQRRLTSWVTMGYKIVHALVAIPSIHFVSNTTVTSSQLTVHRLFTNCGFLCLLMVLVIMVDQ